jgi:hypothetical protein
LGGVWEDVGSGANRGGAIEVALFEDAEECGCDFGPGFGTQAEVDVRQFVLQAVSEAFDQTTDHDDGRDFPLAFALEHFVDDLTGLAAGGFQERAGVDENGIDGLIDAAQAEAVLSQLTDEALAIDGIFRTAEGNEGHGRFGGRGRVVPA